MGVPSFYRWLVGKYPKILINAVEEPGDHVDTSLPNPSGMEFDNLYIDMNSIIHPCFHPEDQLFPPTTIEEVFKAIFQCVDRIFRIVRPRKLLYIAIDGVAPRAKMNHQRARRFQTAKEAEKAEAVEERMTREFEREGKTVLPKREHEVSDSNIITPGTVFMEKLSKALEYYIRSRLNSDPGWKTIKVILSDANVPGEGEHKIMAFIRVQRSLPGYNPNLHHCLCGPDADLIMLALASHEIHFSILREDVLKAELNATTYQFLNIWTLREYLELDMNIPDFKIDIERIIDDFIFICLLLGNDFLPHLPSLEIHEGAIDLMIYVYKKMFKKMGGYLVDMSKINDKKAAYIKVKRVERFILEVGSYEDKIFDKRNRLRQRKLQRLLQQRLEEEGDGSENGDLQYDMKYGVTNEVAEIEDGAYKFSVHNKSCSNFRSSETISKSSKEKRSVSASQNLLAAGHDGNDDPLFTQNFEVIKNTKELKQKVKDFLRDKADLFKNGDLQNDKVHLGSPGWKARYYREKFSAETSNEIEITRTNVVEKYVEGLCWVLQYYFARVRSWSWYFPFYYGPFASDFKGLSCSQIKFKFGCPFKPFDQLMAVLPPKSSHALPKAYRPLMNSKDSTIFKFYPTDFDVDMDSKRFLWQGVCKLPFIEEELLLAETRMLERELEVDEMERNSFRNDKIFVRNCHALGLKMCSICTSSKCTTGRSEQKYPMDAVSCGIGGFLCPYDDHLGPHNFKSPIEGMDDIAKDNTFSTFFINPDWPEHIPRLLEDVDIPEKTITVADIVERKLWHEYEGSQPQIYNHETRYLNQARSFGRGRGTSQAWRSTTGGSPVVNANNASIHRGSDVSGCFPGNSAAAFRGYQSRYGASGGSRAVANGDWRNRRGAELAVRGHARDSNNRWWNGGEGRFV